jgi:hypothetical protein
MRSVIPAALLAAVLATGAGCTAAVVSDPYAPDLVYVSPGVQVIADYNEPIFYSSGLYWRYYGGVWYRSSYYTGGWVYATPPAAILRIDRPNYYVRYRPAGWAARPRGYAPATPAHSGWRGGGVAPAAPARPGGWRGGPAPAPAQSGGWRGAAPAPAPRAAPAGRPGPRPGGGGWR